MSGEGLWKTVKADGAAVQRPVKVSRVEKVSFNIIDLAALGFCQKRIFRQMSVKGPHPATAVCELRHKMTPQKSSRAEDTDVRIL